MSHYIKIPLILALATFLASGLLMFSEQATHEKIAEQKKILLLNSLKQLIPDTLHDNDLTKDSIIVNEEELLGHRYPQTIYIGKTNGEISVVAIPVTARNGYSGDIDLLIGIKSTGAITSVKILEQHETPGLGDLILPNKSDWIQQFPHKKYIQTDEKKWQVKRDGGQFDQITGATITPRAVVGAIKKALIYYKFHFKEKKS